MKAPVRRQFALLTLALACATPASTLALHRCTAPNGKVTYTDEPCETGSRATGVEIYDSSGMEVNKRTNNFSHAPRGSTAKTPVATSQKTAVSSTEADRKIRCRQAQNNNRVLNTPRPVSQVGKKGYLDDAQRDAAIQTQTQEIAENCR